jgi:hypothetical protein
MNQGGDERSLAFLIERSAELKRALVDFALSPRMERHLERFMLESAGPDEVLIEDEAIDAIDRFALLHRLPNGKTVLDQFLASWPDLSGADREMLCGWRDPVDGIFEIRGKDRDSLMLLNLVDDLEYRTYSNMGAAAFRPLPKRGFVYARLVPVRPVHDAWPGLRVDAGLPQIRCPAGRRGRTRTGDQTARTGLPQSRESRASVAADAGGQGRVHGVLRS